MGFVPVGAFGGGRGRQRCLGFCFCLFSFFGKFVFVGEGGEVRWGRRVRDLLRKDE